MGKIVVICALALLGILVLFALERKTIGGFMSDTSPQNVRQCSANVAERDERSPEALAYSRRQIYGFEEEISLTEAVKIFNAEQKCYSQTADPLTEDEVIASILAGPDYGSSDVIDHQYDDLVRIATEKRMPKGALFVFEGDSSSNGAFIEGDIFIEGQRLYLFLHLDEDPRMSAPLKNSQVYLIRKRFVSSRNMKIDRTQQANQ